MTYPNKINGLENPATPHKRDSRRTPDALPIYCTLCGNPLQLTADEVVEFQGTCPLGHRWIYVGEYLRRGDFAVFQVEGFQCDQGRPYPEVAEAFQEGARLTPAPSERRRS